MSQPHEAWASRQIAVLLELGASQAEAERSVKWVLDNLPEGADPATWIPPAELLWVDPGSEEAIQDARAAWYSSPAVQSRFRRLLDVEGWELWRIGKKDRVGDTQ